MNYISVDHISKNYGEKVLFDDISFGVNKGQKTALVADNGAGKSTLLKIIVGEDYSDSGEVVIRNGIRISFLSQEPNFNTSNTIDEVIEKAGNRMQQIIDAYDIAVTNNSKNDSKETRSQLEFAIAQMDVNECWDYDRRLKQLLTKLKITDTSGRISEMSGGQIKRLSLALTLLDNPDVLLLDEPTNHLDIEIIEWLEEYLMSSAVTLLMVTHDRYFLDRICDQIIELTNGAVYTHNGNYSYFLEKRAERQENNRIEVDKAKKLMKKELDWIRRMPKARTTKSKARIDSFHRTKSKATSLKKEEELKLEVAMSRIGGKILEMDNVSFNFPDKTILNNFSYTFKKGERIGFVGNNGTGKTTFLNLVMKNIIPQTGTVVAGETIVFGHYRQEGIKINDNQTVLQVVKDIAEIIPIGKDSNLTASQFLNHFMFPPKVQNDYVSNLSGGERRRLYLLTVLVSNPNFLILDEPTNDLDLLALNKLEEFLGKYSGCLILVSHDRYFLDKLVDHLFVFEGDGTIRDYYSNYSNYKLSRDTQKREAKSQEANTRKIKQKNDIPDKLKVKVSYKEKREYESLTGEIEKLEFEKVKIEEELNSGTVDYDKIQKLSQRIGEVIELIDDKTLRWMELDELMQ
ncbi:MAG: ABC-F family ATP-binding cassette domain-containing protein [Lentimicrobiaceae bacterium]|jgi:ATP-binding cassette subfamily F protein uup|nr:ABC-F family ATP-binding cassette domain-containing protein [Lentimicrobiaceae bacterium]MCP4910785.1 ABC-F family ATP-binding cassette domain-containing protein [Bacteroidota bacterium]MBT3454884.1 ABC-F family ATP-binding cassette domain-containing protein [Lentimicrobiaceae bacterium]MBT3818592.1 ABC-F family ATP-binding cassette domain-containing protein [Lentimicrobiaceae bacterium]MBT4061911.1 ABC-F family ATP-binding cassette domain-containing protein [Lentimicrobiaceae bacterium]